MKTFLLIFLIMLRIGILVDILHRSLSCDVVNPHIVSCTPGPAHPTTILFFEKKRLSDSVI